MAGWLGNHTRANNGRRVDHTRDRSTVKGHRLFLIKLKTIRAASFWSHSGHIAFVSSRDERPMVLVGTTDTTGQYNHYKGGVWIYHNRS